MHLGSVRNCIELDAKQGELVQLMQMFVPRSHIGIFRNEHTQSATLDRKLMFWCITYYLGAFQIVSNYMKLHAKQSELVQLKQKFVPRSHFGIFHNERTQSAPLDPKLMFWCIV